MLIKRFSLEDLDQDLLSVELPSAAEVLIYLARRLTCKTWPPPAKHSEEETLRLAVC